MTDLAAALLSLFSALAGVVLTILAGFQLYKRQHREQITQKYIDEFLSDAMLKHRIIAGNLCMRLQNQGCTEASEEDPFTIERLARGFWRGENDKEYIYYKGPTDQHSGLNEHQSLEAILQYISRLTMNIDRRNIKIDDFKFAVRDSFISLDYLLWPLISEIESQIRRHKREGKMVNAPGRIERLHKLRTELELDKA